MNTRVDVLTVDVGVIVAEAMRPAEEDGQGNAQSLLLPWLYGRWTLQQV
jgi:hypothetical protein